MTPEPVRRHRRRRPWFTPEVPDALLFFAAYLIVRGSFGAASGALIYAGTGTLGLWMTMRTEWRRNRRGDRDREGSDEEREDRKDPFIGGGP